MNVIDQVALVPVHLDQNMLAVMALVPVLVLLVLVVHRCLHLVQNEPQTSRVKTLPWVSFVQHYCLLKNSK